MKKITIKKGLDLPISGKPEKKFLSKKTIKTVAVLGSDFPGVKPKMLVKENDTVKKGQTLFIDKRNEKIKFASPGGGVVKSVNRGAKRVLESVVVELGNERIENFKKIDFARLDNVSKEELIDLMCESGIWTSFKARPYGQVAVPEKEIDNIFINAMDSSPLGPDMNLIIQGNIEDFRKGLRILEKLTQGKIYICQHVDSILPNLSSTRSRIEQVFFTGPHPSGLPGTHMHYLSPVSPTANQIQIGFQDVVAIARTLQNGEYDVERIIAIGGYQADETGLIKTCLGASISELIAQINKNMDDNRLISGCVLSGHNASVPSFAYLGRYHQSVSIIKEGNKRTFLGMLDPGFNKFSIKKIFFSSFAFGKKFNFTTNTNGSKRAIVPIGSYESVLPLKMLATFLLRAIITKDSDQAIALGAHELLEEDLGLCTFACPAKYEYGSLLRELFIQIEKEG